jgi:hypothetical protein
MSIFDEVGEVLNKYTGSGNAPTHEAETDFNRVAMQVPQSSMAGAVSNVFRSDQTSPFGQMVSQMFGQSSGDQRAGILNQLIAAAGGGNTVTPEQAQQVSPQEVNVLAEQAHKNDPSIVDRAGEFYAQHTTLVQGLGAGALALLMSYLSRR